MGIKLADIKADRRKVAIELTLGENPETGEEVTETLNVVYRPSAYTANSELELNQLRDSNWKSEMGLRFVEMLVVSWDLEDDDGNPFPINTQSLADLPSSFIGRVVGGIGDDMGKALAR